MKRNVLISLALGFLINSNAQISRDLTLLYQTQLKAIESYYRLNQISEAKVILGEVDPKYHHWEWQLLNARADRSVYTLKGHNKAVVGIAISPDGKLVASGSADQSILIRNTTTYELIQKMNGHQGQITSLDFSPDGQTLISVQRIKRCGCGI